MNKGKELKCKTHSDGYKEYRYLDKKKGMSDSEIEAIFGVLQQVPVGDIGTSMGVEGLKGKASVEDKESQGEDMVFHPSHYQGDEGLEAREVMQNFTPRYHKYGGLVSSDIKDSIKYILRAPLKNGVEDIDKAINMLQYAKEGMIKYEG